MGIDPKNIDLEQLKKTGADLTELVKSLEKIFNGVSHNLNYCYSSDYMYICV